MIIGIGTDIVYIPRIAKIWKKYGNTFLNKVFSSKEIEDSYKYTIYSMKVNHFAKRFAAKEAYVKALGTGFNGSVNMPDIIICNDNSGKPNIFINNISHHLKNYNIKLSITDDKNYAMAFVILEDIKK